MFALSRIFVRAMVFVVCSCAVSANGAERARLENALAPKEWERVEKAVDRALEWLSQKQLANGSFPAPESGQPAITSLGVMAFLSRGHQPGIGPYGTILNRAIEYTLKSQRADGLMTYGYLEQSHVHNGTSHTGIYNHAIAGLMLCEVYGGGSGEESQQIKNAIQRALDYTYKMQKLPRRPPPDEGGWRYIRPYQYDEAFSDLSVTGWQLMFLRSAKNAEFNVTDEVVESAMRYVRGCYDENLGRFRYVTHGRASSPSRAMAGAGILSLSMGGEHQSAMAKTAGEWVLAHPFSDYAERVGVSDRFHYGAYYCSQAMAQLGGRYWTEFFPPLAQTLLGHQGANGSWMPEDAKDGDAMFGSAYTTALSVLSLTPPLQLLPIYQR